MNLKEVKQLIDLMNENNLGELEIERDGLKIRLKKEGEKIKKEEIVTTVSPAKPSESTEIKEEQLQKKEGFFEIRSPMVGTFYRASSPNAEAFVETGQEIEEDQVVCIIEAMKLMNEIKSEVKGKIVEILVKNGEAVEFDQLLFRIEIK